MRVSVFIISHFATQDSSAYLHSAADLEGHFGRDGFFFLSVSVPVSVYFINKTTYTHTHQTGNTTSWTSPEQCLRVPRTHSSLPPTCIASFEPSLWEDTLFLCVLMVLAGSYGLIPIERSIFFLFLFLCLLLLTPQISAT